MRTRIIIDSTTDLAPKLEGQAVPQELSHRAERAVDQAGEGLTEENRAIFYESLDTITKNLRRICQEGLK